MGWSAPKLHLAPPTSHQPWPGTCGPLEAEAEVGIVAVLAGASMAAGLAMALIDVGLTVVACVAWLAEAGEGGNTVLTGAIMTGVRVTLVNVHLTVGPCVTWIRGGKAQEGLGPVVL